MPGRAGLVGGAATAALAALVSLVALVVPTGGAAADADISVSASIDRRQLQVGESADLAVEIEGTQNASIPEIAGAEGLTVRYVGPSTQVSFVNGKVSSSVTHHFRVAALKPGRFTLGPIRVEYADNRYEAGTVAVEVVAATGAGGNAQPGRPRPDPAGGRQLGLVLSASKSTLYLRERVPLKVQLRVGNVRIADVHYPMVSGNGVALAPLTEPVQQREQSAQGTISAFTFTTTLTPLRSGTLTVGPATLELAVVEPGRGRDAFFDRFFGGDPFGAARRPLELHSEPLNIEVLPLPDAGKPADFSGAVGRFDFAAEAAPRELKAGDPVTVTLRIRGEGSLEGVSVPALAANDALRVYPVQPVSPQASGGGSGAGRGAPTPAAPRGGASDERIFEQVVIPQGPGPLTLPELRFSYFDPTAGIYRTVSRGGLSLDVRPAAAGTAPAPVAAPAAPTAPVTQASEALGHDIVFIKDTPGDLMPIGTRRARRFGFWACQSLPFVAWIAAFLFDRQRRRLRGDPRYARFTRAGREARRAIATAHRALRSGDRATAYDTVARAVRDYLAAKLDLAPGGVSTETVAAALRQRRLAPAIADELAAFFAACDSARFAPGANDDGDMQRTLAHAETIVRALERQRRLGPVAAVLLVAVAGLATFHGLGRTGIAPAAAQGAAPGPGADSPNTIFFRANTLYGEERYAEAAAEYERVLAAGRESGNLYFNLGNAYFKAGDVGRALLNYERARRLIPRDPDLLANLGYARARAGIGEDRLPFVHLAFPLADRASTDELLLIASLVYTAFMLLLTVRRLVPRAARGLSMGVRAAGAALVIVLASTGYRVRTVEIPRYAVVIARADTSVRFEPSASGTTYFQAKPGTVLRVLAERETWMQVARSDGTRGWIEREAVAAL